MHEAIGITILVGIVAFLVVGTIAFVVGAQTGKI